jgi:N-acetyl-1-D-myo-inositol-2-amino-2-deoxy-alpha-D-glucopyranoside deacetylase
VLRQAYALLRELGEEAPFGAATPEELPFGDPDETVTTQIDARAFYDAKMAAMRAHATQIAVDGPFFALSNNVGQQAMGTEYFRLVRGPLGDGPDDGQPWRERDLFAGLDRPVG